MIIGETPRESMWRLIVVIVLSVHFVAKISFGATEFFLVATGAIVIALVSQILFVARVIPDAIRSVRSERDFPTWFPRSLKMWASTILDNTGQYLEIIVIGAFLGPTAAGFYFVATRITNGFAMISASLSTYATSRLSALYYGRSRTTCRPCCVRLRSYVPPWSARPLSSILVAGKLLLSAFGADYVAAYPALIVLAAGAAVGALAGPAQHVLLLTGHEGAYPRIMGAGSRCGFCSLQRLGRCSG